MADVREQAAAEAKRTPRTEHDWTRVPTADETADTITRAQRAIAELASPHRRRPTPRPTNKPEHVNSPTGTTSDRAAEQARERTDEQR